MNFGKTQALNVRTHATLIGPDGADVVEKPSMVYLGGLLNADGRAEHELSRRLGKAGAEFEALRRVWSRASLSISKKIRIFDACVLSSLGYSLKTTWFGVAARRRMDGFHARCLRKILGIPHAYYSRVSNAEVLRRADRQPFSTLLLEQQLLFFGGIASGDAGPIRDTMLVPGSLELVDSNAPRRCGRPRHTWAGEVLNRAVLAAGGAGNLQSILIDEPSLAKWRTVVRAHCRRQAS